jgi:(R,R)-butanediol dehydrogenase/meso-butanediol dehydrogenase/diacetyl reductase
MRAARYHGPRDVRIEDVPAAAVGPNDVRVEIAAAGICGTDLHEYTSGPIFVPDEEPNPLSGETRPVTMGHEFAGRVAEVGEAVESPSVGDHVAVNPLVVCRACPQCEAGRYNLCTEQYCIGLAGGGGGFAEHVVVDAEQAIRMPESLDVDYGGLVEPFAVALHAVRRSPLGAGDTVAVFGAGPIGLAIVQLAHAAGARTVVAVEPREGRRRRAGRNGAELLVDPSRVDPVDEIHDTTDGGVDVAFEAAGIGATYEAALESTHPRGNVTVVSIFEEHLETDPNTVVMGERTVTGSFSYAAGPHADEEFGAVVDMWSDGRIDPEVLVTGRVELDRLVADGFERLLDPESDHVKLLVEP